MQMKLELVMVKVQPCDMGDLGSYIVLSCLIFIVKLICEDVLIWTIEIDVNSILMML